MISGHYPGEGRPLDQMPHPGLHYLLDTLVSISEGSRRLPKPSQATPCSLSKLGALGTESLKWGAYIWPLKSGLCPSQTTVDFIGCLLDF